MLKLLSSGSRRRGFPLALVGPALALAWVAFGCAESGELVRTCRSDNDCTTGVCQAGRCQSVDSGAFDVGASDSAGDSPTDAPDDRGAIEVRPLDRSGEEIPPLGGFLDPCTSDAECESSYCIDGDEGRFCTQLCNEACPEGFECRVLANTGADATRLCLPERDVLCEPCSNDTQCGGFGAFCLEQDDGTFCATDCSLERTCPEHYVCNVIVIAGAADDGTDLATRLCEPEVPACSGCIDRDRDDYGVGWACLGSDCDDTDDDINPGQAEVCNGIDDDCLGGADDPFDLGSSLLHCGGCDRPCQPDLHELTACLEGVCERRCEPGWFDFYPLVLGCETPCTPNPETGGVEVCNFVDDDCNGVEDDGFDVDNDPAWCGDCTACDLPQTDSHLCVSGVCRPELCDEGWDHCDGDLDNGCETDIFDDLDNCGGCDEVCVLNNALVDCLEGDCRVDECVSERYADCNRLDEDGCEIDLFADLDNCGDCDAPCELPGAEALCGPTGCSMGECLPQFYDLDPDAVGCEYGPCPGDPDAFDVPDDPGLALLDVDADCDGIDGDIGQAVFVSSADGSDASSDCTVTAPCQTLTRALLEARSRGLSQVLVQAGVYGEIVDLTSLDNGVAIYGGYDSQWRRGDHRSEPYETLVIGGFHSSDRQYMTVRARGTLATFDNLELVGADAFLRESNGRGLSSYVVHAALSALTFHNVTFDQGNGYSASAGANGVSASSRRPTRAAAGGNSSTFATACGISNGAGGGAGRSNGSCPSGSSTRGGNGGRGGSQDTCCACLPWPLDDQCGCFVCNCDATNGARGNNANSTPSGFGLGGGGGNGGDNCTAGSIGGGGRSGFDGTGGTRGDDRGFLYGALWWAAEDGGRGFSGADGTGGGGGGGGGGCDAGTDSTGAGGGGGGGGGCRAPVAGRGGRGGGGSFGVFGVTCSLTVTNSTFQRGNGGRGGRGGNGGSGQPGGLGGLGGGGSGANGGGGSTGGMGGDSGGGGGGGGGLSVGIYTYNSSVTRTRNTFNGGAGGAGGAGGDSPGNDGQPGDTGARNSVRTCSSPANC